MNGFTTTSLLFVLSMALNAAFAMVVLVRFRGGILRKLRRLGGRTGGDAELSSMNRTTYMARDSGFLPGDEGRTYSVLFLSNSIGFHPPAPEIGWSGSWGMAATKPEFDYIHRVLHEASDWSKGAAIRWQVINLASFERDYRNFDLGALGSELVGIKPDLVIIQVGDNVALSGQQDELAFQERLAQLVNFLPMSRRILTTPFFASPARTRCMENVAKATGSSLVHLSHLAADDPGTLARSEASYAVSGVGRHPGDRGMERIAALISIQLRSIPYDP